MKNNLNGGTSNPIGLDRGSKIQKIRRLTEESYLDSKGFMNL